MLKISENLALLDKKYIRVPKTEVYYFPKKNCFKQYKKDRFVDVEFKIGRQGYREKSFVIEGKYRKFTFVRLVCLAVFQMDYEVDFHGMHLDGNRLNDDPMNFAVGTRSENHEVPKVQRKWALTKEQRDYVRCSKERTCELAKKFGVTDSNISYLRKSCA